MIYVCGLILMANALVIQADSITGSLVASNDFQESQFSLLNKLVF